jgi:hypothetical protein
VSIEPSLAARIDALATSHTIRTFRVRRRDTFLRWLLSFGGEAHPIAPHEIVTEWRALLQATRAAQMVASPEAA